MSNSKIQMANEGAEKRNKRMERNKDAQDMKDGQDAPPCGSRAFARNGIFDSGFLQIGGYIAKLLLQADKWHDAAEETDKRRFGAH